MTRMNATRGWRALIGPAVTAALTAACGGGGGSGSSNSSALETSSALAAQCVIPRPASTVDPFTGRLYGDGQGSVDTEKSWVRAWLDDTYLWYRELPTLDAANYASAVSYFNALKTPQTTATGSAKDRFHFSYPTPQWVALAQSGTELGYGIEFAALSTTPPRRFVVAFVEPGSPAALANIARGAELVSVDGVDFATGSNLAALNAGLFPASTTPAHNFGILDAGASTPRNVTLTPAQVTRTPVQNVKTLTTATGKVGYLQFNDHVATSEALLIAAVNQLQAATISDLVLDIRYNGGGYLDIASELAFMVAGSTRSAGKVFERTSFNDKNPFGFTAEQAAMPFHATAQGFSATPGQALPQLNLARVYVLTGGDTCSASESIINSLRGIGVQVVQIGSTTCGKPYGFFAAENCGTTYFAIQFQGVNALGFGDYADGFVPGGAGANGVAGCSVADDFTHALGNSAEAQLAAALSYRATGTCPAASASALDAPMALRKQPPEPALLRTPLRENRFYRSR